MKQFVWLIAAGAISMASAAGAQPTFISNRADRVERWLEAIASHQPGSFDESLRAFGAWRERDWQDLLVDSQVFSRAVVVPDRFGWVRGTGGGQIFIPARFYSSSVKERMQAFVCAFGPTDPSCAGRPPLAGNLGDLRRRATAARASGDPYYVLRLAALMHFDLVAWGQTRDAMSPTVSSTSVRLWLDTDDGRGGAVRRGGVQWQLAYGLVDSVLDYEVARGKKPRDRWIRDWYVATATWMQWTDVFDESHTSHALRYFPDDPDLHFLSATQHEIDGGKILQAATRSAALPVGAVSQVAQERSELRGAASEFRRALNGRSAWPEARLRLGRVQAQLGDFDKAAESLRAALSGPLEPLLEYQAVLFLAGVVAEQGALAEATRLYARASALYPDAQSPYIALSQLARQQGNRSEAQAQLSRAFAIEPRAADPWWSYLQSQARHSDSRLAALRAPFRSKQP